MYLIKKDKLDYCLDATVDDTHVYLDDLSYYHSAVVRDMRRLLVSMAVTFWLYYTRV